MNNKYRSFNIMSNGCTLSEAKRKMERYCSYQERCHQEVVLKLKALGMIPLAIDAVIAHLIQENFLSEERFAKSFARGKFRLKKWGRDRIVRELQRRDISQYNITSALKEIDPANYRQTLDSLAKKRMASLKDGPLQVRRRKLADYLLYRGWEPNLVYDKVRELLS